MKTARLDRLFQHPVVDNDPVLIRLLQTADRLAACILIAPDFLHMTMEYVGEGMEKLTGYSCRDWMIGGVPLLVARAAESDRNRLASLQAMHVRQAKMAGFNRRTIDLQEYQWTLLHRDGQENSGERFGRHSGLYCRNGFSPRHRIYCARYEANPCAHRAV